MDNEQLVNRKVLKYLVNQYTESNIDLALIFKLSAFKKLIENITRESFKAYQGSKIPSPQRGIIGNVKIIPSNPKIKFISPSSVNIYGLEISLTVMADGINSGSLYSYDIKIRLIEAELIVKNSKLVLTYKCSPVSETIPTRAPDGESEYLKNIERLIDHFKYTPDQVSTLENNILPAAGFMFSMELSKTIIDQLEIFDLVRAFPSFKMNGDFEIHLLNDSGMEFISLVPAEVDIEVDGECGARRRISETTGQYESSGNTTDIGQINIPGGPQARVRPLDMVGEVSIIMSRKFIENSLQKQAKAAGKGGEKGTVIAKSSDRWEIPPFLVKHNYALTVDEDITISDWNDFDPLIKLYASLKFDLSFDVRIKVFKMITDLVSWKGSAIYELKYQQRLLKDISVISLWGELIDPTNFKLKGKFSTPLPRSIDRVLDKLLNDVVSPVLGYFIAYYIAIATWPLVSEYIFKELGELLGGQGGRKTFTEPSGFCLSDTKDCAIISARVSDDG